MANTTEKNVQYEVIQTLGRNDKLVQLSSNPRVRKMWPTLSDILVAMLVTRKIKGMSYSVMTDSMRYPSADIGDLYSHRWEIELGYRE